MPNAAVIGVLVNPNFPPAKAQLAELETAAQEITKRLAEQIVANIEFATKKLMSIASAELDLRKIKASDKIRAIEVLAKLIGWNTPENVGEELKIERIEWVIVDPKKRDGGGVPPPAGEGET